MISEVVAGDRDAWQRLVGVLFPAFERIAKRSPSMGPLRSSEDHARNVATETLRKLERNNYHALGTVTAWLEKNPGKTLTDWLHIVATNAARSYVEAQLGSGRSSDPDAKGAKKRMLHTLASALPPDDRAEGVRPAVTIMQMARQILEYASEELPPEQFLALQAWLTQTEYAEAAKAAGANQAAVDELSRAGEKLVRAAVARLRRGFGEDE